MKAALYVQVLVGQPWAQLLDPDLHEEHVSNAASGSCAAQLTNTGMDFSMYQTCAQRQDSSKSHFSLGLGLSPICETGP